MQRRSQLCWRTYLKGANNSLYPSRPSAHTHRGMTPTQEFSVDLSQYKKDITGKQLTAVLTRVELQDRLLQRVALRIESQHIYRFRLVANVSNKLFSPIAERILGIRSNLSRTTDWTSLEIDAKARAWHISREKVLDEFFTLERNGVIEIEWKSPPKTAYAGETDQEAPVKKYKVLIFRLQRLSTKKELADIAQREHNALQRQAQEQHERQEKIIRLIIDPTQCVNKSLLEHFGDRLPEGQSRCERCFFCYRIPEIINT